MKLGLRFWGFLGFTAGIATACGGDSAQVGLCGSDQVRRDGQCLDDLAVAVNGVGLLPGRTKRATFVATEGSYEIVDADSGAVVHSGTADGPQPSVENAPDVFVADFTDFDEPGRYLVRASGLISGTFEIGPDALAPALDAAMLGLYGQRCGESVEFEYNGKTYSHGAGHLEPALLTRVGGEGSKDDTGGWHDAGDYGKYVRNGAFSVAFLLHAYEHFPAMLDDWEFHMPEQGGETPDILDEARVELEWILKTQFEDGSFAHKVTALGFEGEVSPTADDQQRYFFSTSTSSTANAVAVLASAGRIFVEHDEDFASTCLDAAQAGQKFLDENPQEIESNQEGASTGTYGGTGDTDERAWALAELWATTKDADRLAEVEAILPGMGVRYNFDWPDTANLAFGAYLTAESDDKSPLVVETLTRKIIESADDLAGSAELDVYGRGFDSYYWGSAGVVARMSYNLVLAHRIFPNEAYLNGITLRVDHVLGLNPFARSWVTGLGANPPQNPHHRPSVTDSVGPPWPGLLIGGANPDALSWTDAYASYQQNEIAINWNTALVYALVAAMATQDDESAACVPDCLPDEPTGMGGAGGAGQ